MSCGKHDGHFSASESEDSGRISQTYYCGYSVTLVERVKPLGDTGLSQALRGPGESYSDVILALAEATAERSH